MYKVYTIMEQSPQSHTVCQAVANPPYALTPTNVTSEAGHMPYTRVDQ